MNLLNVAIDIHKFLINNTLSKKDIHVEGMVHSVYNTKVGQRLNSLPSNLTPAQAEAALIDLVNDIRIWINSNPGINLNNIVL